MNSKLILLTVVLFFGSVLAEEERKTSYEGHKVIDLFPTTQEQADLIAQLEHRPDFDLWSRVRIEGVKASLSPEAFKKYEPIFRMFKIRYEIVNHNLQETIDEEARQLTLKNRELGPGKVVGTFGRHTDINNWIDTIVRENPATSSLKLSNYTSGQSSQGRDMKILVIGTAGSTQKVWIDCGIHAREWISPCTCIHIADNIITDYRNNVNGVVALLGRFEFHILPVVNPDGYEFAHSTTRLWRKCRGTSTGTTCIGTDLNRNFPYQWLTGGSSTDPCSDTFAGRSAASAPETKSVMKAVDDRTGWIALFTIHTYGKWVFTPYGWSGATQNLPPDYANLKLKADIMAAAIQSTYGQTGWVTGNSAQILYVASGGTEDWAYGTKGIRYSYCLELRPGQTGNDSNFGFQLPVDRCPLAGRETYNGLLAFLNAI